MVHTRLYQIPRVNVALHGKYIYKFTPPTNAWLHSCCHSLASTRPHTPLMSVVEPATITSRKRDPGCRLADPVVVYKHDDFPSEIPHALSTIIVSPVVVSHKPEDSFLITLACKLKAHDISTPTLFQSMAMIFLQPTHLLHTLHGPLYLTATSVKSSRPQSCHLSQTIQCQWAYLQQHGTGVTWRSMCEWVGYPTHVLWGRGWSIQVTHYQHQSDPCPPRACYKSAWLQGHASYISQVQPHFLFSPEHPIGRTLVLKHDILLQKDAKPVYIPAYRIPHSHRQAFRKQISKLLDMDLIKPSISSCKIHVDRLKL